MKKKVIAVLLSSLMVFQPISAVSAAEENAQFQSESDEQFAFDVEEGTSATEGAYAGEFTDIEDISGGEFDDQGETVPEKAKASVLDYNGKYLPTDVSSPSQDCSFVGIRGNFLAQADQALARINEIRLEACREGLKNPSGSGNLTMDDYVPIKWSSDLEYIARIRAAESSLTIAHARTNGKYIFQLSSPNSIRSEAEVLAWNGYDNMIAGINQWYAEKKDYINHTGAVTGHYTSMIDPKNLYVGLATFCSDAAVVYNTTAGEYSTKSGLDETQAPGINDCIQILDMKNSYLTGYNISGSSTGKAHDQVQLQLGLKANIRNKYSVEDLTPLESVTWSSSDDTVASVDQTGLLTANRCGTADITVQDASGRNGSFTFTVNHIPEIDSEKAPTCETEGKTEGSHCSVCGEVLKKQGTIPATGHKAVTDKGTPATCETEGKTEGSHCSVCGKVLKKQETIPATGHKTVTDKATPATCETEGKTEGSHCSVCGKVLKKQETIPATGHKTVTDKATPATCETEGKTEGSHCSVCGKVLKKQETIPVTGHKAVTDKGTPATCETEGKTEGSHCSVCGKVLKKQETIPATGHKAVTDKGTPATCETEGKTEGSHCSVCGKVLKKQETIPATGHKAVTDKGTPATCETEGKTEGSHCSVCGKVLKKQETIPVTGHKAVTDKGTPATCETEGKTEGSHCSVCGKVLKKQETIPATGHKWGSWTTVSQATVSAPKQQARTCSICKKQEKKSVGKKLVPTAKVNYTNLLLKTGQTTTVLKITGLAKGDYVKSWKSSNTKIVKVDKKGKITAQKKDGTAYVTASLASGKTVKVKITVQKPAVKTKSLTGLTKSVSLKKGKTLTLKPKRNPITSTEKITFTSSNKKIVQVSSKGVVKAVAPGKAYITVKCGSAKYVVNVSVPKTK